MESKIQHIIEELVQLLGFGKPTVSLENMAQQKVFRVETTNNKELIGPRGETLRAIEYLVKKIAEKDSPSENLPHFIVDVDGYRAQHIKDIQQRAVVMAERAKSFRYDVELAPMSAYERLIIHATLADVPNIKTESKGEGKDRRVVIKYAA